MKTPNLLQTKNYTLFGFDPCNRSVDKITKLKASMQKYGFLAAYPLHCVQKNGKLVVKDGQHRLATAQALGLPVFYVVLEDDHVSIPEINCAQRKWSTMDFVDSFVNAGNADYKTLKQFREETNLPISVCASLLGGENGGSANKVKEVKMGTFKIKRASLDFARKVADLADVASKHVKWSRHDLFLGALSNCCRVPEFVPATMIERMNAAPHLLVIQPNTDMFHGMLEVLYNHRSRSPLPLRFMANESARGRNPVVSKKATK